MADRYPLVVDSSAGTVKELPSGDNLDLSSSSIVGVSTVGVANTIYASAIQLTSNGGPTSPIVDFGNQTGMYQDTEEEISIGVGGTERIHINPIGNIGFSTNVGLGTTATTIDLGIESAKKTASLTRAKPPVGIGTSSVAARSFIGTQVKIVEQNTTGDIFRFQDEYGNLLADSNNSICGTVYINCYHKQSAIPGGPFAGTEGIESFVFSLNHTSFFTNYTAFVGLSTARRVGINTTQLVDSIQLANDSTNGAIKITATTRDFDTGLFTVTFVGQLSRRFIGTAFGN